MEQTPGVVKHILLARFKEEVSADEIEQLIKDMANMVNLIPPMKSFHWGTDEAIVNMDQGFTHVFEATFESNEGVAEYMVHPVHVEFANRLLPKLEKVVVMDYKPTHVQI